MYVKIRVCLEWKTLWSTLDGSLYHVHLVLFVTHTLLSVIPSPSNQTNSSDCQSTFQHTITKRGRTGHVYHKDLLHNSHQNGVQMEARFKIQSVKLCWKWLFDNHYTMLNWPFLLDIIKVKQISTGIPNCYWTQLLWLSLCDIFIIWCLHSWKWTWKLLYTSR